MNSQETNGIKLSLVALWVQWRGPGGMAGSCELLGS